MELAIVITNALLVLVGLSAFATYFFKKHHDRRDAAIMIVLQLEEINKNIISVGKAMEGTIILETSMFETNKVMNENLWSKYKHLLVKKIGMLNAASLNEFYQCAENIMVFQMNIKGSSQYSMNNSAYIYQTTYANLYSSLRSNPAVADFKEDEISTMANNIASSATSSSKTYIPRIMGITLDKFLTEHRGLKIETACVELKKIAGIK